jgi:membrane protease YdiL (CAAX protease family)
VASSLIFGLWFFFRRFRRDMNCIWAFASERIVAHAGGFLFGLVAALLAFGAKVRRETSY